MHTLIDNVSGQGHYVGTYLAWRVSSDGWWGEGEFKFYIDGDSEFPTICGTGTDDYFCGSHNFDIGAADTTQPRSYTPYLTPYAGLAQIGGPEGVYLSQQRFGMYRWHIVDPIRFGSALRVTVQALDFHLDSAGNATDNCAEVGVSTFIGSWLVKPSNDTLHFRPVCTAIE